jgi:hypothetical protein
MTKRLLSLWCCLVFGGACGRDVLTPARHQPSQTEQSQSTCAKAPTCQFGRDSVEGCEPGFRCFVKQGAARSTDGVCVQVQAPTVNGSTQPLTGQCDECGNCTFNCEGLVGFACPVGYRCVSSPQCCDDFGTCERT